MDTLDYVYQAVKNAAFELYPAELPPQMVVAILDGVVGDENLMARVERYVQDQDSPSIQRSILSWMAENVEIEEQVDFEGE